jgi:hypothetical protein
VTQVSAVKLSLPLTCVTRDLPSRGVPADRPIPAHSSIRQSFWHSRALEQLAVTDPMFTGPFRSNRSR